jgi:alkylhydroperoxidase family enzyme
MSEWSEIARADDLARRLPDALEAFETIVARAAAVDVEARRAASPVVDTWVEQFVADVSAIDEAMRRNLRGVVGDDQFPFVVAVWALDMDRRLQHAWRELAGDASAARGPSERVPDAGDLWVAVDTFLPIVSRVDHLDAVTTEVVRVRGARANNCRLCRSLRNVDALAAGADDGTFDAIDRYEASALAPSLKAALRLTDAMLWTPTAWPRGVASGVREHFSPDQAAELVFDVVRNGANRIAVALGADEANVSSGVEYFTVGTDGQLTYGLAPPHP